jgi:hypothetical protein
MAPHIVQQKNIDVQLLLNLDLDQRKSNAAYQLVRSQLIRQD